MSSVSLRDRNQEEPREPDALRLLTCVEMAAADRSAPALGISLLQLMENAGRAVGQAAADMVGVECRVVVLCGPGNNGGDGFVAARYLEERGRDVVLGLLGARDGLKNDAAEMARRYDGDVHAVSLSLLDGADLVVDALFGAGLNRPIEKTSELGQLCEAIASRQLPVLAVDVPSGLSGDTGALEGAVMPATGCVTFFRRKPGHVLQPGRTLCGDLVVADIGLPAAALLPPYALPDEARTWANGPALWRDELPGVAVDGHKYHRGHAVVVSGDIQMAGAARLAATAALRIGSGLVTIAAPPDAMVAHAGQLSTILLSEGQSPDDLVQLLEDSRKNAVVIGPGMGLGIGSLERVIAVLASGAAVVLDADAITSTAVAPEVTFPAIKERADRAVVLTPHEGEFARLFPHISGSKLERARAAAGLCGGIIVLKGSDTVIAAPDGRAVINDNAPPWLATAGSGDVLAGMIGGLLAQRMPAFEAACAAVWMHGAAANAFGRGLIATDIVGALPAVWQHTAL
jgi:ADP-dependent NAD(P)H-hydrate dehydratase / NAD(P)H-hydrate epimerase